MLCRQTLTVEYHLIRIFAGVVVYFSDEDFTDVVLCVVITEAISFNLGLVVEVSVIFTSGRPEAVFGVALLSVDIISLGKLSGSYQFTRLRSPSWVKTFQGENRNKWVQHLRFVILIH